MEPIRPAGPGEISGPSPVTSGKKVEGERSFEEILRDSIDQVNQLQQEADQALEKVAAKDPNMSQEQMLMAYRKAQVAFETLMQIRNKLVDAFQDIQQMRV